MKTIYIYLDTKIIGAVKQTINYFNEGVFSKENTVIVWKEYQVVNSKIKKLFSKTSIKNVSFKKFSQLPNFENNSVIFYLFNAQSNCRITANRNLKHIFITHGESNKISSVKPIIRIYDHVIVAGDAGIDRFLDSKLFSICDIEQNRIIKMGNTFIGDIKLSYDENSENILYAPTWEGGVKEENYTSLSNDLKIAKKIVQFAIKYNKKNIIIQPHPNLGHRDLRYKIYLINTINYFHNHNLNVFLKNWEMPFLQKIRLYVKKVKLYDISHLEKMGIFYAFCDVSAIETQLLDKKIPYFIFFNKMKKAIPSKEIIKEYYRQIQKLKDSDSFNKNKKLLLDMSNYYIGYEEEQLKDMQKVNRVQWLVENSLNEWCF